METVVTPQMVAAREAEQSAAQSWTAPPEGWREAEDAWREAMREAEGLLGKAVSPDQVRELAERTGARTAPHDSWTQIWVQERPGHPGQSIVFEVSQNKYTGAVRGKVRSPHHTDHHEWWPDTVIFAAHSGGPTGDRVLRWEPGQKTPSQAFPCRNSWTAKALAVALAAAQPGKAVAL